MAVGALTGVLAAIFNLDQLMHMMSIGTLMAYSMVAACIMLLRYEVANENEIEQMHNALPISNGILHHLWNADNIHVPTKLTAAIVTIQVTIFCKFVAIDIFLFLMFIQIILVCHFHSILTIFFFSFLFRFY